MWQTLLHPKHAPLRPYLLSPIRLLLCCKFWQTQPSEFPVTSAHLYAELTTAFYEWKQEWVIASQEQRQRLSRLLGELGKTLLLEGRSIRDPLSQADMDKIFGKHSPLLRLAIQLGWVIPRGLVQQEAWQRGYGFFDRTFRDYFTALAIDNWQFFLDGYQHHYRIFESKWLPVLRFWLGRSDIPNLEKSRFMEALLEFNDHCSPENF